MRSELMERINELSSRRQELFREAAAGILPMGERGRLKEISIEIEKLWDAHRRQGHPPAVPPVKEEWERGRRGRRPKAEKDTFALAAAA